MSVIRFQAILRYREKRLALIGYRFPDWLTGDPLCDESAPIKAIESPYFIFTLNF